MWKCSCCSQWWDGSLYPVCPRTGITTGRSAAGTRRFLDACARAYFAQWEPFLRDNPGYKHVKL